MKINLPFPIDGNLPRPRFVFWPSDLSYHVRWHVPELARLGRKASVSIIGGSLCISGLAVALDRPVSRLSRFNAAT
jgi:hypothetical protein